LNFLKFDCRASFSRVFFLRQADLMGEAPPRDTAWAMSQENVENCRRAFEAWNRRDFDGWLDQAAPDFEWIPANPAAVERNVYRGDEEIRQAFAEIWEIWEVFRLKESEIRDLGDSLVWLGHVHARGKASHVELDHDFGAHILLRDHKAIRAEAFLTWQEALEAAGLEE
jgi:ketosteroid isomerase-like protein